MRGLRRPIPPRPRTSDRLSFFFSGWYCLPDTGFLSAKIRQSNRMAWCLKKMAGNGGSSAIQSPAQQIGKEWAEDTHFSQNKVVPTIFLPNWHFSSTVRCRLIEPIKQPWKCCRTLGPAWQLPLSKHHGKREDSPAPTICSRFRGLAPQRCSDSPLWLPSSHDKP